MATAALDDEERIDIFIAEAARAFDFLCEQHAFDASTEIWRNSRAVTVSFARGQVAIEAILDLNTDDLEVKVARLERGRKPDVQGVDEQGERWREHLVQLLLERGVRGFGIRRLVGDDPPAQRFGRQLDRYAVLLAEHCPDILGGSADSLSLRSTPLQSAVPFGSWATRLLWRLVAPLLPGPLASAWARLSSRSRSQAADTTRSKAPTRT